MITTCKKLSTTFVILLLSAPASLIQGCSSESSSETSSGGGGSNVSTSEQETTPTTPAVSPYAGTYTGTAVATASALGITESDSVAVTIIIDENGQITVQSGSDIFPNVLMLNGNTFSQNQTFNEQDFGSVTCSGTLTLAGSINNGVLNADLSSQAVSCNGIPGTVNGSLSAARSG
jgi:hypothetical protein